MWAGVSSGRQGDFFQEAPRRRVQVLLRRLFRGDGTQRAPLLPHAAEQGPPVLVPDRLGKAVASQFDQGQGPALRSGQRLGQGQHRAVPVDPGQGRPALRQGDVIQNLAHSPSQNKAPLQRGLARHRDAVSSF